MADETDVSYLKFGKGAFLCVACSHPAVSNFLFAAGLDEASFIPNATVAILLDKIKADNPDKQYPP